MYAQIFGRFLVEKNYLTKVQWEEAVKKQRTQRPRLGMIAVEEKCLTEEEAEKINRKQQQEDKRFGDIAVEYQFLTEKQVEHLLAQQGNPYHSFYQIVILDQLLTEEEYRKAEEAFCEEKHLSAAGYEDIKSGDIDRILPHYMEAGGSLTTQLAGIALRAFIRLIHPDAMLQEACEAEYLCFSTLAVQNLVGDHTIFMGLLSEEDDSIRFVAEVFGKEAFSSMNDDACDAVCEFLNCVNGMFASTVSYKGTILDMLPPSSYQCGTAGCERKLFVLPVLFEDKQVQFVIGVDKEVTIEEE